MQTLQNNYVMKDKNIAAVMALFLGTFGIHKFYLGRIAAGVLYAVFSFTLIPAILGVVDFLRLLLMDEEEFNFRYNTSYTEQDHESRREARYRKRQGNRTIVFEKKEFPVRDFERTRAGFDKGKKTGLPLKSNKNFQEAITMFENYQYKDARKKFEDALLLSPDQPEILFRLACCNSLLEEKERMFSNLEAAIKNGFNDFDRIKNQDALAFLRIQREYDNILNSGFRKWPSKKEIVKSDTGKESVKTIPGVTSEPEKPLSTDDLLVQLKKLGELRQTGVLTEEEFLEQKQKLFA